MAHLDGFEADSYLKSGANELRVLEYNVCGMAFGINILKVKKVVSHMNRFMSMPESHAAVRGVFEDRGIVVPLIDLAYFLGLPRDNGKHPEKVIITEFFEMQNGFWVDRIDWIHHFRWEDVIDAGGVMHGFDQKYVIGIVKPSEDKMVLLLDYENIILDICPQLRKDVNKHFEKLDISGNGRRILVAEDSPAIRSMLVTEFSEIGFVVDAARDGQEGLEKFQEAEIPYDLVISDVEMPRMDGLALTVAVRSGKQKDTPVIVYSSIGDIGMKARANFLKANAHITKLNFDDLLKEVDRLTRDKNSIQEESPQKRQEAVQELLEIQAELPEPTEEVMTEKEIELAFEIEIENENNGVEADVNKSESKIKKETKKPEAGKSPARAQVKTKAKAPKKKSAGKKTSKALKGSIKKAAPVA